MVGVCFSVSTVAFQQQWDYVLCNFEPDEIYVLGELPDATTLNKKCTNITTADDFPDVPLVLLAPDNGRYIQGTTSLDEFTHPEDCIYMYGSDALYMNEEFLGKRKPDHIVYIDTDTKDDMYSFVSYGVVMYDRRVKWQS